ncbi:g4462 [Coccomyxa elongata]
MQRGRRRVKRQRNEAPRVCNSWTAGELDVAGKAVPLCRGCQHKCHHACAKVGTAGTHPNNTVAATSTALLALDRAWEEYLNKLRLDNGMLVTR